MGEHLVQNLSSVIHKHEFDSFLDAGRNVLIDVRFACSWDDELWSNEAMVRKVDLSIL